MNQSLKTGFGDRLVPALLVADMTKSLEFYSLLGFEVTGRDPESGVPTWAEVRRDGVVLQFHTDPPQGTQQAPVCSGTFYLYPDSVAEVADALKGKIPFEWGPEVMGYGIREFGVRDPNGYFIAFAEYA